MKTFISALLLSMTTFSISAFAGFYTGEEYGSVQRDEFMEKVVKVNGYQVRLGRGTPDYYGNFSDQEVTALTPLLTQALEKLPSAALLRAERRLNLVIQVVKGYNYNVERKAERGYLRIPAQTTITLMIPPNAITSDLALFFGENITVTANAAHVESKTHNVGEFMQNLVSPRVSHGPDGCEIKLINMLGPI